MSKSSYALHSPDVIEKTTWEKNHIDEGAKHALPLSFKEQDKKRCICRKCKKIILVVWVIT